MKIQLVSESFLGYLGEETKGKLFGGQELLLAETIDLLIECGHEVEVLQFGNDNWSTEYNGAKVTSIRAPNWKFLQKLGFIKRWTWSGIFFYRHINKKADWVHFHNHHFSFPCILKKQKNQIFTGMNHGVEWDVPWVYEKLTLKNIRDRFAFALLKSVTRFSIRRLDKLITNDRFFVHFATLKNPYDINKFSYIPNYYDERIFDIKKEHSFMEIVHDKLNGSEYILLPKMSMRERGTDLMLSVMKRVPNSIKLVITGTSHETKRYINKVAMDEDLIDRVIFTGHIDYSTELPGLFLGAKMVVIPSPCREATAIALLEAMAMKKPVVVSEIGGLVEVVNDGISGILHKPNVDSLFKSIMTVLKDPQLAEDIAKNGHAHVTLAHNRELWKTRMSNFFGE